MLDMKTGRTLTNSGHLVVGSEARLQLSASGPPKTIRLALCGQWVAEGGATVSCSECRRALAVIEAHEEAGGRASKAVRDAA